MIFSMKERFDEFGIYWNHDNGGWMKTIIGLDKTKKNGYSLIGDFVNAGFNRGDYNPGLYLNCNKFEGYIVYQLINLHENGSVELLQELVNPGRGWAVELWEKIDENIGDIRIEPSYPSYFLNYMHLKAYLQFAKLYEIEEEMISDMFDMESIDLEIPKELSEWQKHLRLITSILFKGYNVVFNGEIDNVNDLLNLSYLTSFKSDGYGYFMTFQIPNKYNKMTVLFSKKGDDLCINWVEHRLE